MLLLLGVAICKPFFGLCFFASDAQRPLGRWWSRGDSAAAEPRTQARHFCSAPSRAHGRRALGRSVLSGLKALHFLGIRLRRWPEIKRGLFCGQRGEKPYPLAKN